MGLTRIRAEQISDIDYKQAVRVIQRTNVNLTGGAPSSVDSVNLATNDRILVTGQDTGSQNGIYRVQTLGTGANGTWVRTNDGNTDGEIEAGMIIMVTEGEIYKDTQWKLTTNNPIIIGTTSLTFVLNAVSVVGGENTQVQYNQGGVLAGSANLTFNGSNLSVGGSANVVGNVTANYFLGNGSQLSGIITSVANINNGTSNVDISAANADITMSVNGTANVVVISTSGMTVTGNTTLGAVAGNLVPTANLAYSLGNATNQWANIYVGGNTIFLGSLQLKDDGGNTLGVYAADGTTPAAVDATAGLAQYVTEAAQGNITSVGTLTSLSVTGNVTAGNLTINTDAVISGNLTVQGTETIFNVNTLTVNDKDIVVANNVTGGANVNGAGFLAGNPTVASLLYNDATTSWQTNVGITPSSNGTLDIGTTSNRWGNAWVNTITATGNANVGNIGATSVVATNLLGTVTTASQPNITTIGTLGSLVVTGNIIANNISGNTIGGVMTTASQPNITDIGTLSYLNVTGNIAAGNISGNIITASQPGITAVGILSSLVVAGNVSAANVNATLGAFTQVSGNIITAAQPNITSLGTLGSLTVTGNITAGNLSVAIGTVTTGSIVNANANGVGNIGSSTNYFNTVFAKATSAQYADLAEIYQPDTDYIPGTVVVFGGSKEITESTFYAQMSIAGVISTHPAHIMNAGAAGLPVALQGRVPCRVTGTIRKGDLITSSELPGIATRLDPKDWMPGSVIGKALESHDDSGVGVIEVVVGRV